MNTQTPVQKFETWAIVELLGHQQMAGKVTEQNFGPATFFRIEVPETSKQPAFDRLVSPAAIYAINPVTEEVARARALQIEYAPIHAYDVRQMLAIKETNQPAPKSLNPAHIDKDLGEDEDWPEDQEESDDDRY